MPGIIEALVLSSLRHRVLVAVIMPPLAAFFNAIIIFRKHGLLAMRASSHSKSPSALSLKGESHRAAQSVTSPSRCAAVARPPGEAQFYWGTWSAAGTVSFRAYRRRGLLVHSAQLRALYTRLGRRVVDDASYLLLTCAG